MNIIYINQDLAFNIPSANNFFIYYTLDDFDEYQDYIQAKIDFPKIYLINYPIPSSYLFLNLSLNTDIPVDILVKNNINDYFHKYVNPGLVKPIVTYNKSLIYLEFQNFNQGKIYKNSLISFNINNIRDPLFINLYDYTKSILDFSQNIWPVQNFNIKEVKYLSEANHPKLHKIRLYKNAYKYRIDIEIGPISVQDFNLLKDILEKDVIYIKLSNKYPLFRKYHDIDSDIIPLLTDINNFENLFPDSTIFSDHNTIFYYYKDEYSLDLDYYLYPSLLVSDIDYRFHQGVYYVKFSLIV